MDDHVLKRPAGLDFNSAFRVRRAVAKGERVDDPSLRPAAEFYVDQLDRLYDQLARLRFLNIAGLVAFTVLLVVNLLTRSPWGAIVPALAILACAFDLVYGPRFREQQRRRLDVNRPDITS